MADPPIRRSPPPIPPVPRAPVAPAAAETDVVPSSPSIDAAFENVMQVGEDTSSLQVPDVGALVQHMLELVNAEVTALLASPRGDAVDARLADLNIRTALVSWDALRQTDEAQRQLELAEKHPLAPRLRLAAALLAGTEEALAAVEAAATGTPLAIELVEAWLWRHGRGDRAGELADRVLRDEALAPPVRAHVVELAALAHASAGNWARVIELRRAALDDADPAPEAVAEVAALLLDRGDAPAEALGACWAKLEHFPGPDEHAVGWLRTFDVAIDAATRLDDERRYELLDKRAELVAALPGGSLEALATRHAVASELERGLQHAEAASLWAQLAEDPAALQPGAARRIALVRAAWSAVASPALFANPALTNGAPIAPASTEAQTQPSIRAVPREEMTEAPTVPAGRPTPNRPSEAPTVPRPEAPMPAGTTPGIGPAKDTWPMPMGAPSIGGTTLMGLGPTIAAAMRKSDDGVVAAPVAPTAAATAPSVMTDLAIALSAHRRLADSECVEVAATHAWRALELAAVANDPSVGDLARAVVDAAGGSVAERWLDLLELEVPNTATLARVESRGGLALRVAAAIAERLHEMTKARALWQRAAEIAEIPTTRDHLVRILRNGDDEELAHAYTAWAKAETDRRVAAPLWCARGIADLVRGDFVDAEDALQHAADLAPDDPFSRAALAAVYRADKRHDALARILGELATTLTSPDARAAASREHAELLLDGQQAGDAAAARAVLERMLADRPDDPETMLALAKLCERLATDAAVVREWHEAGTGTTAGGPRREIRAELEQRTLAKTAELGDEAEQLLARTIDLRLRAAELVPAERRAEIWLEIAGAEERRGNVEAALAALDHAGPDASRQRIRLYRTAGNLEKALELARAELAADPKVARRSEVQKEIALLLTMLQREPEGVVAAYLDVLSIEPDQTEALAAIEGPARRLGLWDELARAFRGAPQTPRNLEVLAEALAKIAEWSELAEVRRRQLEASATPAEKAQRAGDLAQLYEKELGDHDSAIRLLLVAQNAVPDPARQLDLLRLLRTANRWGEVAAVLERELPTVPAGDVDRQLAILLELADIRTRLNRHAEAIQSYEAILERRPGEPSAHAALERLYEQLGRDRELARLLESRAEATTDPIERGKLYARVAQTRAARNDADGALAAYTAAFSADPANRDVFTAMERVAYKAERWTAAMKLYEDAIKYVENGQTRAYRLGDLYARRGNVQLNFLEQPDAAIASYQKVVEVDSSPGAAVKELEKLCAARNDWQPLIAAWEKRAETQRDPQRRTDALRAAAQVATDHPGAGDSRLSLRLNKKLLSIDPLDAGAQAMLERHYEENQDKSGLLEVLKMRLQNARSPDESVDILKKIARAAEEGARDVVTATEHYQKVLEVRDNDREALEALGRIYESTEQWAEFIDVTRKQIKVTNDRNTKALLYFRCGSVMEAKFGREQDAIRYYDAAIKTAPSCLPAVHGLRDLYRRREEWPRVIETLELEVKLWQDDKERAGVFAQIGRIYEKQLNDVERGMQFYESALAVDAECLLANQALFEHFFDTGAWDKAAPLAAALAQKAMREGDPAARSDFYRRRGVVSRHTGDPRGAAESFIVALEIKPTNAQALDDLGALAREVPDAWEFDATYRELEKLYKKRDDADPLLARVYVGRGAIVEREGDLDQASQLYQQATALAHGDFTVLSAFVDYHIDLRHWSEAVAAIERFVGSNAASPADRIAALMRQAAIHADCEMDSTRAIAVLREVLRLDASHQDAYYELAQQCFLIGRTADARAAIERVIELATAPGQPLHAPSLARYYYYKGRILEAAGDVRGATPQYRRAIEYDPGYAPPALILARRAAEAGNQSQANDLLITTAHAAMAQGGPRAAVPLQRGLARILLANGERPAAIEAYRGILNVEPDGASDRVALAEIYAVDDPNRAIGELRKVIDRDIHHAPAYRLLASFYNRTGDTDRASRVLTALDLLGFAEDTDKAAMQRIRATRVSAQLVRPLDDESRERYLLTNAARDPLGEVFGALAEDISSMLAQPSLGANLTPAQSAGDQRLLRLVGEMTGLYGVDAEVFVGEKVPGGAAVTAFPRRLLVIDRTLLADNDPALRFLFGYALEAIRGGYATLLQVGARQRRELAQLLRTLVAGDAELTGPAAELFERASPEAQKVLNRHAGLRDIDPSAWIDGMLALAKRAGLLACDDFSAAIWMVARLAGERLASHDATVALGSVLGGPDLVRFYLSDDYQHLRDVMVAS